MGDKWDKEQVQWLLTLHFHSDMTMASIAKFMGRSEMSCRAKVNKIKHGTCYKDRKITAQFKNAHAPAPNSA